MSIQPTHTVVLANRPRLFRELLQHALNTASSNFRVVEATDATLSTSNTRDRVLRDAHWLIVDDEAAAEATKLSSSHPNLGILALDGRSSRARILAPSAFAAQQPLADVATLSKLFELLSMEAPSPEQTRQPK